MENIFLACFAFGVLFTLATVALGFAGHGAVHFGHGGHGAAHLGHGATHLGGHAHAGHLHADAQGAHADPGRLTSLPLLNGTSVVGALTWFGATGYLLMRLGDWAWPAVLIGALLAAGVGWYLVARFLGLVLSGEREMDPDDYRLEGTVSQVTVGIPAGGTGEVVFSKAGARRSEAARAMGGVAIPRGSEVVITAYTDGFATVQPWGEFLSARDDNAIAPEKRELEQIAPENREA
jgi:membrane protein implicated in regulation of membrane protease activity